MIYAGNSAAILLGNCRAYFGWQACQVALLSEHTLFITLPGHLLLRK